MQRLSPDRAQDPPLWTMFSNKVSLSLPLTLQKQVEEGGGRREEGGGRREEVGATNRVLVSYAQGYTPPLHTRHMHTQLLNPSHTGIISRSGSRTFPSMSRFLRPPPPAAGGIQLPPSSRGPAFAPALLFLFVLLCPFRECAQRTLRAFSAVSAKRTHYCDMLPSLCPLRTRAASGSKTSFAQRAREGRVGAWDLRYAPRKVYAEAANNKKGRSIPLTWRRRRCRTTSGSRRGHVIFIVAAAVTVTRRGPKGTVAACLSPCLCLRLSCGRKVDSDI